MKKIFIAICVAVLLCSCSPRAGTDKENTGSVVTPEELEAVSREIEQVEIIYIEGMNEDAAVFYWTENGSVIHAYSTCSSMSRSKRIYCGNINHAYEFGIERSCSRCFEKDND